MKRKILIALLIVVFVAAGFLIIKKKKAELSSMPAPKKPLAAVEAKMVTYGSFPVIKRYLGTIKAKERADISARVSSYITKVLVREGAIIKKGATVALLDDRTQKEKVAGLEAEVNAARTLFNTQEAIYQRNKMLFENKALSKEALDKSKSTRDSALAHLLSLERALSSARIILSYYKLTAPFNGIVTKRHLDPGDLATPGHPVISMENPEAGYFVEARVPQRELSKIDIGDKVYLKDKQNKDKLICKVSRLHPAVEYDSLAVVEADIDKRPFLLPTGATIEVAIETDNVQGFKVPLRALLENVKESFVYTITEKNQIHIVKVTPIFFGEKVAVVKSSDLKDRMKVVVASESGLLRLHEGQKVLVDLQE